MLPSARVSSVRDRDARQFGKAHLTDGNPETCWASDVVHRERERERESLIARARAREAGEGED